MVVGIIGCGWLGYKIAYKLCENYRIYSTTTSEEKFKILEENNFNPTLISFSDEIISEDQLQWEIIKNVDVLIITIPFSERRNTRKSLETKFQNLQKFIGNFNGQMFFMSSTSVYPNEYKTFSETDLLSENVFTENMVKNHFSQTNILRLGGLMGGNRLLKNYTIKNLDEVVNHIHFEDVILVIEKMIEQKSTQKTYNIVSPKHPTKREVINAQKNTPFQEEKVTKKRIISSEKLILELNFEFRYPNPTKFHL